MPPCRPAKARVPQIARRQIFTPALVGAPIGPARGARSADRSISSQGRSAPGRRPRRHFDVKGINLGNWLVPEGYMFKFTRAPSPSEIAGVFDASDGADAAAVLDTVPRRLCRQTTSLHQGGGLQYRARAARTGGCSSTPDAAATTASRSGLGSARPSGAMVPRRPGCASIVDLHAAPGGQTGGQSRRRPGFPLTFYVPRYRRLTRRAMATLAARYRDESGDPRLRSVERTDLALQRRRLPQPAAGADLPRDRRRHPRR